MSFVTKSKLQRFFTGLKDVFAAKNHTHNDKVDNTETGANGLLAKLTTSWSAAPTDNTYFIRQDTSGENTFGRLKFSTVWTYIKGKADPVYQPKGSYAASGHTHNYAGSSSAGGAATSANKVNAALTINLNGTSQGAWDGSSAKSISITAASVGATSVTISRW